MTFQYFVNNILTDYLRGKLKGIASIWREQIQPSLAQPLNSSGLGPYEGGEV